MAFFKNTRLLRSSTPLTVAAALLVATFSSSAFGKTLLRPVESSNVSVGEVEALSEIFRGAYSERIGEAVGRAAAPPPPAETLSSSSPSSNVVIPTPAPTPVGLNETEAQKKERITKDAAKMREIEEQRAAQRLANEHHAQQQARIKQANQDAANKYAAKMVADHYLELSIIGLGNRIQIRGSRFDREGRLVHSIKVMISGIEEAPEVMERLAIALEEEVSYEDTATLTNLTNEDTVVPKKRSGEFVAGIKTGFVMPYTSRQKYNGYMFAGFNGRMEVSNYFIEFGAGFAVPFFSNDLPEETDQVGGLYAEMAFNAYLTQTDISPYLGLGVSPRLWAAGNDGGGMNVLPFAQLGLMFFRSHSTRLYTDARVGYNVMSLGKNAAGESLRPWEFGWNFGIGW